MIEIRAIAPAFSATPKQQQYVALIVDPSGPGSISAIADRLGVPIEEVTEWWEDPNFRNWVSWECENRFVMLLPLIYSELLRMALSEGTDPKTKIDSLKLLAGRFDQRAAVQKVGVEKIGKEYAREVVRTLHSSRSRLRPGPRIQNGA